MTERSPSPTITLESPRQAQQLLLVVPKVWYTSLPGMAIGHRAACHRAYAVYTRHIPGASLIIEFSPMAADAPLSYLHPTPCCPIIGLSTHPAMEGFLPCRIRFCSLKAAMHQLLVFQALKLRHLMS